MNEYFEKGRTLGSVVRYGESVLRNHEIENASYDSFALLADLLKIDRAHYFLHQNDLLSDEVIWQEYCARIEQRASHVPLQHIIGQADFFGRSFVVNGDVLVPRADTECLVEEAIKRSSPGDTVLDVCTGSGCILITLALECNLKSGVGIDISAPALNVAGQNQKNLNAEKLKFLQSDLFEQLKGREERFDMIVSNPPYIRTAEIEKLDKEVKIYDPMLALDGHDDGLYFYRKITAQAGSFLKKGGWLLYEIGYDQAEEVEDLMKAHGYEDIQTVKDLVGLDRVVLGKLK